MADIVISSFPGIAPRVRSAEPGAVTNADQAENVDLYGRTLRPLKGNNTVEASHNGPEIFFFGPEATGVWESGQENYIWVTQDGDEILVYKDTTDGKFKRRVNGVVGSLGVNRPASPTLVDEALDSPPDPTTPAEIDTAIPAEQLARGTYIYYMTFSKFVSGNERESFASNPITVSPYEVADPSNDRYHILYRPTITEATATQWNLYRSDDGDTARLLNSGAVTGLGEGLDFVTDQTASVDRGRSIDFIKNNSTEDPYKFEYVYTWLRNTGGFLDESGPSDPVNITVNTTGVKVTRSLTVPLLVTKWRLYRISTNFNPTTVFELVEEVDISATDYTDDKLNSELGDAITTTFTTEDGEIVTYDAPEVDFEGLSLTPHYGMLFGWKDDRLYYSEPGKIDAWPFFNKLTALGTIVGVEQNGGELLVMTQSGVQRIVGTDPEKLFAATAITDDGAVTRRGMTSYKGGTIYLANSGLMLVSGSNASSISDGKLGEEYFRSINVSSVFMNFNDGVLYIFHDAGMLLYDTRIGEFTTMPDIFLDEHRINRNGLLYVLDSSGVIKSLHSSGDNQTVRYKTGEIVLSNPEKKYFRKVEVTGTGLADIELFIDGVQEVTQSIDMDSIDSDRQVNIPQGVRGRAMNVYIETEGEVKELRAEVFDSI